MPEARYSIFVNGIVQGVGFRPFIHRIAKAENLFGWVKNTACGVEIELEGQRASLEAFLKELRDNPPALAHITGIKFRELSGIVGYNTFSIQHSDRGDRVQTLVSPDVAVCEDCLHELFDPKDRRFQYPFINCTNCGPRFTIIRSVPYDRSSTTMSNFPMCHDCSAEYADIETRRYHAQPDCCKLCGPRLILLNSAGSVIDSADPICNARRCIENSGIVAVKGLGGIHLACDGDNVQAVNKLRLRKHRSEKPFALMCADMDAAEEICFISPDEKKALQSPRRPIVLLKKRTAGYWHISENGYVGVMLPYTPVHHLLMKSGPRRLVMTSGNISELPIITDNDDAVLKLSGIADMFLLNNRDIYTSCDDSLLWMLEGKEYFVRRSRGYVPLPLEIPESSISLLACGAEQKASFGFLKDGSFFPSQHIGDLKSLEVLEKYKQQSELFAKLFDIKPKAIACDMHPDYLSTDFARQYAKQNVLPLIEIQHHHAHMASCMADNELSGQCLGLIWDGTGYGVDGTAWGGELLCGDYEGFERLGTLSPLPLPGGDKAVEEIFRIACGLMAECAVPGLIPFEGDHAIYKMLAANINCPKTSSIGRLFDGAAALLGIKAISSYEGQGAVLLEAAAEEGEGGIYPYEIISTAGLCYFDWRPLISALIHDRLSPAVLVSRCAARFMNTLAHAGAKMCALASAQTGLNRVVLSGGVFQNIYLLEHIEKDLQSHGLEVFHHHRVSTNDEGISLGQAIIAERKLIHVSCGTP